MSCDCQIHAATDWTQYAAPYGMAWSAMLLCMARNAMRLSLCEHESDDNGTGGSTTFAKEANYSEIMVKI